MEIFKKLPLEKQAYLETIFQNCTEEVRYYMRLMEVGAERTLVRAGDKCTNIYIILTGKVTGIEWPMYGRAYPFKDYGPGDFFGEIECFAGLCNYRISVVTITKCEVLVIPSVFYMEGMQTDVDALYLRTQENMKRLITQTADARRYLFIEAKERRMPPYNLYIINGNIVRITDGRILMSLAELSTQALYSLSNSQHLTAETTSQIKSNAYSFGCTSAEVEVDIPMCTVKLLNIVNAHDAGTLINPALAEAQVHGGMSMGIGFGLSERLLFDARTGRAQNNNLPDCKLSTFMDHPRLKAVFVENPEPTSAFGTKALGEPPTCSVAPAIRNAVFHAVHVPVNAAPLNPHTLFQRFTEEGLL